MSSSKAQRSDPTLEQSVFATMSHRTKRMFALARGKAANPAPRQENQNQSGQSNQPNRPPIVPSNHPSIPVRSLTDGAAHHTIRRSQATPPRSTRSKETDSSTPDSGRGSKRPREEAEIVSRRPGKESVPEVSSDEEIESVMNSMQPRAGGAGPDSSIIEPEDEAKAWKVFQSVIFKKDQVKMGRKKIKKNLKKGSHDLISACNVMYQGYVLAERSFKDIEKMKMKLKEQHNTIKSLIERAKDAEKKQRDAEKKQKDSETEFQRKDNQLKDAIEKLAAKNADVERLDKKVEDQNIEIERLKVEANQSYERGRMAAPNVEQKLEIAREFWRSPTYDAVSDLKAGIELFQVFDKCWKQCRKLGFLNERFDAEALDPEKDDDCEPFPTTDNVEGGPILEDDIFYPIFLEATGSGNSEGVIDNAHVEKEQNQGNRIEQNKADRIEQNQTDRNEHNQTDRNEHNQGMQLDVLTGEQIDRIIDQGIGNEAVLNSDTFDHIDIENLVGNDSHGAE
ncbi:hypothetical protein ACJIZ3_023608 [Penstemon smallii]|uniref:Uncharacterized protein n=1 Tax=Penstemon smallii TaxID=265156 RepID=A0ABD3TRW6_9LAMI